MARDVSRQLSYPRLANLFRHVLSFQQDGDAALLWDKAKVDPPDDAADGLFVQGIDAVFEAVPGDARYIAPVSTWRYPRAFATSLATVLFPAPAGPSIAIVSLRLCIYVAP